MHKQDVAKPDGPLYVIIYQLSQHGLLMAYCSALFLYCVPSV